jgi:hypothetical protein
MSRASIDLPEISAPSSADRNRKVCIEPSVVLHWIGRYVINPNVPYIRPNSIIKKMIYGLFRQVQRKGSPGARIIGDPVEPIVGWFSFIEFNNLTTHSKEFTLWFEL